MLLSLKSLEEDNGAIRGSFVTFSAQIKERESYTGDRNNVLLTEYWQTHLLHKHLSHFLSAFEIQFMNSCNCTENRVY